MVFNKSKKEIIGILEKRDVVEASDLNCGVI
jgi:hypothetical protein